MKNTLRIGFYLYLISIIPFASLTAQKLQSDNGDGTYTLNALPWVSVIDDTNGKSDQPPITVPLIMQQIPAMYLGGGA